MENHVTVIAEEFLRIPEGNYFLQLHCARKQGNCNYNAI